MTLCSVVEHFFAGAANMACTGDKKNAVSNQRIRLQYVKQRDDAE